MSSEGELSPKCRECAKSKGSSIQAKCEFCGKISFSESILCDLNRSVQDPSDFRCFAFHPTLKLAPPMLVRVQRIESPKKPEGVQRREDFQRLISSQKYRYEKAYVLQKLSSDPDFVSVNLKYHFVWNVVQRRPFFLPENKYFDFVHDAVLRCSELVRGFSALLWLAPDHLHVYVESDDKLSPDTLLKKMKQFLRKAITEEFPDQKEMISPSMNLWDKSYFVESVG